MKRGNLQSARILFFVITIFMLSLPAFALYETKYFCQNDICTESGPITFSLKLYQTNLSVKYTSIQIKDLQSNFTIASKEEIETIITPTKNSTILFSGNLPSNLKEKSTIITVVPCFKFKLLDNSGVEIGNEFYTCGQITTSLPTYLQSELVCNTSNDCPTSLFCEAKSCKKLTCSSCQYALNHTCFDYACCESSQCSEGQACIDHKCTEQTCAYNEALENHECLPLACKEDEYPSNHVCKPLNCKNDEKIENHSCVKLNCQANEEISNHACKKLLCPLGKVPENHKCVDFKCGFFQIAEKNECSFNYRLLLKILLGLALLIGIGSFLYKKYKEQFMPQKKETEHSQFMENIKNEIKQELEGDDENNNNQN